MPKKKLDAKERLYYALLLASMSASLIFRAVAFHFCMLHRAVVAENHDKAGDCYCAGYLYYLSCDGNCKLIGGDACSLHDPNRHDDMPARAIEFIENGVIT